MADADPPTNPHKNRGCGIGLQQAFISNRKSLFGWRQVRGRFQVLTFPVSAGNDRETFLMVGEQTAFVASNGSLLQENRWTNIGGEFLLVNSMVVVGLHLILKRAY